MTQPPPPPPPTDPDRSDGAVLRSDVTAGAIEEHRFPCSNCGSDMRFAPGGAGLECPHCGATEALDPDDSAPDAIPELDFRQALADQLPAAQMEETRVLSCDSCGAQVEFDAVTHAKECPFCASPVVTDTGTHRHIKPRAVLPFSLKGKQARDAMEAWLGKLWFAPNGLKEFARKGRPLQGIYLPYWTYDADTKTQFTGRRGDVYYVTRTRVDSDGNTETYQEEQVRWTNVSGRVARVFDDVLVLASQSLPREHTEALEPWDLSELRPYAPEFLAGFRAEGYAIGLEDGYDHARQKMDAVIRRDVRFKIGGDRQKITSMDTDVSDVTFKHVLLPVWLAAYRFRGKAYRCVINGRTGRVQGERPWSVAKIALAVLAGFLLAATIGYVYAVSQGALPAPDIPGL
jgi:DNA-directed RNA polymerase subunit RPC12/RpoP